MDSKGCRLLPETGNGSCIGVFITGTGYEKRVLSDNGYIGAGGPAAQQKEAG
jgi:hypothetical protein